MIFCYIYNKWEPVRIRLLHIAKIQYEKNKVNKKKRGIIGREFEYLTKQLGHTKIRILGKTGESNSLMCHHFLFLLPLLYWLHASLITEYLFQKNSEKNSNCSTLLVTHFWSHKLCQESSITLHKMVAPTVTVRVGGESRILQTKAMCLV